MRVLADENFPPPAVAALRKAGWDVFSILEECPGVSDDDVATLCEEQWRILLTFDKDFGELIFPAGCPPEAGSFCFASRPTIRKRRRKEY
jgi:predicted nuclease of predicted toxin-antitoxin system